jgi:hypothetical protein
MTVTERWGRSAVGWLWAAVAVTVAAALLLAWLLYRESRTDPVPWAKPAQVDGEVVRISYVGSECRDRARVDVQEDRRRVVLTVRETVTALSCSEVGVSYDLEVRLDRPLGDRELVDGACLLEELARRPACRADQPATS